MSCSTSLAMSRTLAAGSSRARVTAMYTLGTEGSLPMVPIALRVSSSLSKACSPQAPRPRSAASMRHTVCSRTGARSRHS